MAPIPMTLSDLEGHFSCLNHCKSFGKYSMWTGKGMCL